MLNLANENANGIFRSLHANMAYVYINYTDMPLSNLYRLADVGDPIAQHQLGTRLVHGTRGATKDMRKGVQWTLKAATNGHPLAQYNIGTCYLKGTCVDKDGGLAVEWWRRSAAQGNVDAQYNLGVALHHGKGVDEDHAEAEKWYRLAARQGFALPQFNLGRLFRDSDRPHEAEEWFRQAADQGHAESMSNLGVLLLLRDLFEEGFGWLQRASDLHNPSAMSNLGLCYLHGEGVPADRDKAIEWFSKAASQTECLEVAGLSDYQLKEMGVDISLLTAILPCRNKVGGLSLSLALIHHTAHPHSPMST